MCNNCISRNRSSFEIQNLLYLIQLLMFVLNDTTPGNPLLLHDEPIYFEGKIVGETTSGNYSFLYNKNLAFGYVDAKLDIDLYNKHFEIEVAKNKYKATVLNNVLHDPKNNFIRS